VDILPDILLLVTFQARKGRIWGFMSPLGTKRGQKGVFWGILSLKRAEKGNLGLKRGYLGYVAGDFDWISTT